MSDPPATGTATGTAATSPPRTTSARAVVLRYLPLAAAAAILIWHSLQYDFITDDAYISFVYSRNFAEHGQLAFNLGDPVEGYTNFLWTFLLGVLMVLGIPPELAAKVLGTGFGLAGLWMSFRIAERALGRGHPIAGLAPLLLACSSGYACWSSGGLETQLYTFLIIAALDGYLAANTNRRALRRTGAFLALASMTRPEGPLITALFGAHHVVARLVIQRRVPDRDDLLAAGWYLAIWLPWFVWRWRYYGYPFPNTYYVKAAGTAVKGYQAKMHAHGLHYVWRWFEQTSLIWASPLAAIGVVEWRRGPRTDLAQLALIVTAVYLVYAVMVGGDFMGLHRFVMPLFVLAALAVTLGVERLTRWIARLARRGGGRLPHVLAGALAALVLVGFAIHQYRLTRKSLRWGNFASDDGIDTPVYLAMYAHDRELIGKRLAACVRPDDFAIYGGVGAMPYYARLRGIDVFGLVSERIAHETPRVRDRAGHNKWGSDPLLLEHHPDIVMHCYTIRRTPGVAPLGCAVWWEQRGFERVVLHVPGLRERGEYYTFLARRDRYLSCPGLSR